MMKEGRLGYNPENDRYGLLVSDLWEHDGFHCGDTMEALVDGEWAQSRMEYGDDGWYLIGTPFVGNLEYVKVRV